MNEVSYYENDENIEGNEAIGYLKDPIARETCWDPLVKGGANFKTKRLVFVNPNRIVFKPTIQMILFGLLFLIIGLAIAFFIGKEKLFGGIFGLIFSAIGGAILYFSSIPIVIDKSLGYFWHSRKEPRGYNRTDENKYFHLKNVYAIQIIAEFIQGSHRSNGSGGSSRSAPYTSYEINLIMKNGSRKNVIDHGKLSSITQDAKTLADFLNVPLWNQMEQISSDY